MENLQAHQTDGAGSIDGDMLEARREARNVAFIMSPALGDTLNLLAVAHNLSLAGWRVDVYGKHAHALADWFPRLRIEPALDADNMRSVLTNYPYVVQMHRDRPFAQVGEWHTGFIDLHDVEYAKNAHCMARRFTDFAAARFDLHDAVISNGMRAPAGLQFRRHARRVVIHPEASTPDKRWLPGRFLELARRLRANGFEVEFVVEARERTRWETLAGDLPPLRSFASTALLAEWLYESGWFIGNDSGVGHLASSLGLPTLTVFRRRGIAERWRPGFSPGDILLPAWWVPTAGLKERWWRESISVARVMRAFDALRSRAGIQEK
jgi:heptosyltransferase III